MGHGQCGGEVSQQILSIPLLCQVNGSMCGDSVGAAAASRRRAAYAAWRCVVAYLAEQWRGGRPPLAPE
jgi:hypothetical protein